MIESAINNPHRLKQTWIAGWKNVRLRQSESGAELHRDLSNMVAEQISLSYLCWTNCCTKKRWGEESRQATQQWTAAIKASFVPSITPSPPAALFFSHVFTHFSNVLRIAETKLIVSLWLCLITVTLLLTAPYVPPLALGREPPWEPSL